MRIYFVIPAFLAMMSCGEVTALNTDSGAIDGGIGGMAGSAGGNDASLAGAGGRPTGAAGAGAAGAPGDAASGAGGSVVLCCEPCGTSTTSAACMACPDPPKGYSRVCGCGTTAQLCCCFNVDGSAHCSGSDLPVCQ